MPTFWTRRRLLLAVAAVFVAGMVATGAGLRLGHGSRAVGAPADSVVALDPVSGRLAGSVGVGGRPRSVVVGGGSVWVANAKDGTLSRVDPRTLTVVATVPLGAAPNALAAAGGSVWVSAGPPAVLLRLDAASGRVARSSLPDATCGASDGSLAVGSGSVWTVCGASPGLVRVDSTSRVAASLPDAVPRPGGATGRHLSAVAFGGGLAWVVDRGGDRATGVDPATNQAVREMAVGAEPVAVAVGYGWVWVVNSLDNTVSRFELSPAGQGKVETIPVGVQPTAVAVGEGSIWVVSSGSRSLSRIDPQSGDVKETIGFSNEPVGVATGAGRVWVTVDAP